MRRPPVQPRSGHTAFPNELLARALAELAAEPLRLLVGLYYEAEFKREGTTTPDGRWRVGFGQVLVSYSGLADRYGMTVDAVRCALRRFRDLGVTTRPAARPNEPAEHCTTDNTSRRTNRPNVVDFGEWAAFLGGREDNPKRNTSTNATAPANPGTTIQHGNTGTRNTETSPAAARARESQQRRPVINDATELGPLGAEYRGRVERELGHGLAFGRAQATRDELERLLRQEWLGIDRAVEWTVATARSRRGRPGAEPGSVEWCLTLLRELRAPDREPGPDAAWLEALGPRRAEAEAQWALVRERVARSVWPDRRAEVLAQELEGLRTRFVDAEQEAAPPGPEAEPRRAAGGV